MPHEISRDDPQIPQPQHVRAAAHANLNLSHNTRILHEVNIPGMPLE